ncbi:hypothetical protein BF17_14355 [Yersinia similis]|uniref:DUF2975 domain-containing protein n=1 Tax=Yersinia similis TaxID=367190 RepID=A0ABN4CPQ7_9GAMM|nr:hypothetical protein [Yersinia similis]AHK20358.1 hypothetical protein BF17_14355 [Yersinia similis]CFQ72466.1 Uncharacterised protein [Yersinia similis]
MNLIKAHINKGLKVQFTVLFLVSVCFLISTHLIYNGDIDCNQPFYDFYQKNLRGYLFSGFISVGSFLLSLHTFVIVSLKDKLFSTESYKNIFADSKNIKVEDIKEKELYLPLDRLSCFLNLSIWLAIITAISQFTVGLANYSPASIFCIWLAMLTICFMLNSLILIRENIKVMLKQ